MAGHIVTFLFPRETVTPALAKRVAAWMTQQGVHVVRLTPDEDPLVFEFKTSHRMGFVCETRYSDAAVRAAMRILARRLVADLGPPAAAVPYMLNRVIACETC